MNKKNIIIISTIVTLVFILVLILIAGFFKQEKNVKSNQKKESVIIADREYEVFSTTELKLESNELTTTDMNNIAKLKNLEKLDIKSATIEDLDFLTGLSKLISLKITVPTKLQDYTPIKKLTNLFTLEIYGNIGTSVDMSFLTELTKLSTLYLTFQTDRNLEFINSLKNVSTLSLDVTKETYDKINEMLQDKKILLKTHGSLEKSIDNTTNDNVKEEIATIEDGIINWSKYNPNDTYTLAINVSEDYKDIEKLQSELNKLTNFKKLNTLTITANSNKSYSVTNLDFLSGLTNLEKLRIDYLNANDTTGLSNLTNLKELTFTNGNMASTKFSSLSSLTNLEYLNLNLQNITDISFLKDYKKLQKLYLSGNNITDITYLQNLTTLKELYIGCNKNIKDVSPLTNLTNLENLMVTSGNINERLFANMKELKNLYLGINYDNVESLKNSYPNINIELLSECV